MIPASPEKRLYIHASEVVIETELREYTAGIIDELAANHKITQIFTRKYEEVRSKI